MATANVLHRRFNETITKGVFSDNLKLADVTLDFKEDDPFDKKLQTCQRFTQYI